MLYVKQRALHSSHSLHFFILFETMIVLFDFSDKLEDVEPQQIMVSLNFLHSLKNSVLLNTFNGINQNLTKYVHRG